MRFLHTLVEAQPSGRWNHNHEREHLFAHHGKELVIFISDLYDEDRDILKFLRQLKTSRNEVIVFHVIGTIESDLNIAGSFSFRDLEGGTTYQADADQIRNAYRERFAGWMLETKSTLLEMGIFYHEAKISEYPSDVLRRFINVRSKLL